MNPLALFYGPYGLLVKWGVIVLLIVSFGVAAWIGGNAHGTRKLERYIAKQAIEAVRLNQARIDANVRVVTKYKKVAAETEFVWRFIEKEVDRYVEANSSSCLDADWRRLHDAAAANTLSDARLQLDGAGGAPTTNEGSKRNPHGGRGP